MGFNDEIEKVLIKNWNETVKNEDIVLHLGDLYFESKNSEYRIEDLNNLNGNKILLIGNHDRPNYYNKLNSRWKIIDKIIIDGLNEKDSIDLKNQVNSKFSLSVKEKRLQVCYIKKINEEIIMFTHFPLYNISEFDKKYDNIVKSLEYLYKKFNCTLNIHGHTHSNGSSFENSISACVEKIDFNPITIDKLINKKLFLKLKSEYKLPLIKIKKLINEFQTIEKIIDFIKNTKDGYFEFGILDYKESDKIKELRKKRNK